MAFPEEVLIRSSGDNCVALFFGEFSNTLASSAAKSPNGALEHYTTMGGTAPFGEATVDLHGDRLARLSSVDSLQGRHPPSRATRGTAQRQGRDGEAFLRKVSFQFFGAPGRNLRLAMSI